MSCCIKCGEDISKRHNEEYFICTTKDRGIPVFFYILCNAHKDLKYVFEDFCNEDWSYNKQKHIDREMQWAK